MPSEAVGISKYGSRKNITYAEVINAFLPNNSVRVAAELLGLKHQTLEKYLLHNWVFKFSRSHKENWCTYLLRAINLKVCSKCLKALPEGSFFHSEGRSRGIQPLCKACEKHKSSTYYMGNTEKVLYSSKEYYNNNTLKVAETHKKYWEEHKGACNARTAKRRATKLQRTPSWAQLDTIKEIYTNCPIGFHVDHIIPLQGALVSGLHVENNLQYLSVYDNLSKGNTFEI